MNDSPEFITQISSLLTSVGLKPDVHAIKNCTQGRNNRTYRIQTGEGSFVVKQYLRQEGDTRDRLASEFAFLSYAKQVAPSMIPQPFFQDLKRGMALYEYLEGEPLQAHEITAAEVNQAAQFFCALNEASMRAKAADLPQASEACFSIQEHFDLIGIRIQNLENMKPDSGEDQAAKQLVNRLSAYWCYLVAEVIRLAQKEGIDLNRSLDREQRCISPSDFGFHNALKMPDGRICFLDFEYAGWDDPAKMTGDFFSQLALPVPAELFTDFVQQVMQPFPQAELLIRRARLLRWVYRVKWCCIALNIFLPVHLARYRFSNPKLDVREFKCGQIDKVAYLLKSLESQNHGLY